MLYQLSHFRSMHATIDVDGAESQDRTGDTAIFSRVLYQLSYLGPMANQARSPVGGGENTTRLPSPSTASDPSAAGPAASAASTVLPAGRESSIRVASRRSRVSGRLALTTQ